LFNCFVWFFEQRCNADVHFGTRVESLKWILETDYFVNNFCLEIPPQVIFLQAKQKTK